MRNPINAKIELALLKRLQSCITDKFANVDHPECFHKGDSPLPIYHHMEKDRRPGLEAHPQLCSITGPACFPCPFSGSCPPQPGGWRCWPLPCFQQAVSYYAEYLGKKELTQTVETQKAGAEGQILESNIRYNNALLVQEIGQAASKILTIDDLLRSVVNVMEKRLDF